MLNFLSGKKTYAFALLLGAASALHYLHYINDDIYKLLVGITSGGGLAALRMAISDATDPTIKSE